MGVICNAGLSFVLVLVITHGLEATAVGVFFESIALFHIAASVAQFGADIGLVRTIPRFQVLGRTADIRRSLVIGLGTVFVAGVALAVFLFAFAPELSRVFTARDHGEGLTPLIRLLAPFLPVFAAYMVALAATRGFGTMVPTTVVDKMGKAAAQPLLIFIVIAAGLGGVAVVLAWVGPIAVGLVITAVWLRSLLCRRERDASRRPGELPPRGRPELFREFWRFTAPRGLAGVFAVIILWLDTLLIGALRSTHEAGIYAAATRYLMFGSFASLAILQVIGPKLSELLAGENHERASLVYGTATSWGMALAWPIYLTIAVFAPVLLSFLGADFVQAQTVLVILGSTMLVATAAGPVDVVLLMGGKSSWNLINTIVAVALNIGLNLLLVPRLGIKGAAIAWSVSILTNNLAPLAQVWILLRLHPFGRGFFVVATGALLCFGALGLAMRQVLGSSLSTLIISGVVGAAAYSAILWRFREELELLVLGRAFRARNAIPEARVVAEEVLP